eukprot:PhM_4_TR10603/c0_g1_i1/m.27628
MPTIKKSQSAKSLSSAKNAGAAAASEVGSAKTATAKANVEKRSKLIRQGDLLRLDNITEQWGLVWAVLDVNSLCCFPKSASGGSSSTCSRSGTSTPVTMSCSATGAGGDDDEVDGIGSPIILRTVRRVFPSLAPLSRSAASYFIALEVVSDSNAHPELHFFRCEGTAKNWLHWTRAFASIPTLTRAHQLGKSDQKIPPESAQRFRNALALLPPSKAPELGRLFADPGLVDSGLMSILEGAGMVMSAPTVTYGRAGTASSYNNGRLIFSTSLSNSRGRDSSDLISNVSSTVATTTNYSCFNVNNGSSGNYDNAAPHVPLLPIDVAHRATMSDVTHNSYFHPTAKSIASQQQQQQPFLLRSSAVPPPPARMVKKTGNSPPLPASMLSPKTACPPALELTLTPRRAASSKAMINSPLTKSVPSAASSSSERSTTKTATELSELSHRIVDAELELTQTLFEVREKEEQAAALRREYDRLRVAVVEEKKITRDVENGMDTFVANEVEELRAVLHEEVDKQKQEMRTRWSEREASFKRELREALEALEEARQSHALKQANNNTEEEQRQKNEPTADVEQQQAEQHEQADVVEAVSQNESVCDGAAIGPATPPAEMIDESIPKSKKNKKRRGGKK